MPSLLFPLAVGVESLQLGNTAIDLQPETRVLMYWVQFSTVKRKKEMLEIKNGSEMKAREKK